jgi:hypothetical protein
LKDQLAEKLLAQVMGWKNPEQYLEHGSPLQSLASYKYDEYQQFSPGMRFIESLARWLDQFETVDERQIALAFVRERLVFISSWEMNHLVSISYPDYILPFLLSRAASESGLAKWYFAKVAGSLEFRVRERRCLFLGLSDGSRTDVFRRANPRLWNEQVRQSHELSEERVENLRGALEKDLESLKGRGPTEEEAVFQSVVLLDDFSGSGFSYIRDEADGTVGGKVGKFINSLCDESKPICTLFARGGLEIILVLYMATETAERVLSSRLNDLCARHGYQPKLLVIQKFPENQRIFRGTSPDFDDLIETYYDKDNESSSTDKGGTDLRYGFAGGGLPLVLSHNAPNNSIGLLHAEGSKMRALFPRVTRHRDIKG